MTTPGSDLDSNGVLLTETGKRIPRLRLTPGHLLEKTITLYGPSKTGKSVFVKHIMQQVNGFIDQILVVSPTEPSNRSYEGFVDPPFIHYRLFLADPANPKKDDGVKGALRFLEAVWQRQEMMAAIYTRANNAEVLAGLFARLPREVRAPGVAYIESINRKRRTVIDHVARQAHTGGSAEEQQEAEARAEEKIKSVNEKFKKMLVLLYKKYIIPEIDTLWGLADLTDDEKYSLQYMSFNPRILLIFDDCAAQLKPFFAKEIFRKLFYQNRHSYITVVICCQDDTDLPANLRKSTFISIFTEPIVCMSNFTRTSNQFPKTTKAFINEIVHDVFRGHRKLAYIREDDTHQQIYHVTCPFPKKFRFGSKAVHDLSDEVGFAGATMDKENPFYDRFKI